MALPAGWIDLLLQHVPAGPALDLGVGDGDTAIALARAGHAVVGVDLDAGRLQHLKDRLDHEGVHVSLARGDARSIAMKRGAHAAIVLANVLQFMRPSQAADVVQRAVAALKTRGLLLIVTFSPDDPAQRTLQLFGEPMLNEPDCWLDGVGTVFSFYGKDDVTAWLGGLELLMAEEVLIDDDHPPDGRHLHGLSAVLARKPAAHRAPASTPRAKHRRPAPAALPLLGVGVGLRRWHEPDLLHARGQWDCLEVMTDEVLDDTHRPRLAYWASQAPLVAHGVALNLGSPRGRPDAHIAAVADVAAQVAWHSDHLCFSDSGGAHTNSLVPLPFTDESLALLTDGVRRLRRDSPAPFLVENIAYYLDHANDEMDEAEFLRRFLVQADTGLLLDICNVVVNAHNHGYDPMGFLARIPCERVVQLHLAGGHWQGDLYVDSHSAPVAEPTWRLYEEALRRTPARCVIVERDDVVPLSAILPDVERARALFRKHRAGVPR